VVAVAICLEGERATAKHEAAHAVVGWRLNIPVRHLSLSGDGQRRGGAVCDWESLRGELSNRETCIRGFAVAFAGAIHDTKSEGEEADFYEIWKQLPTNSGVVVQTREKLKEWEGLAPTADTDQESVEGFRLAERLIGDEHDRIARLGEHLFRMREMDEAAIVSWFAQDS